MSNKIKGKDLGKMIKEFLNNKTISTYNKTTQQKRTNNAKKGEYYKPGDLFDQDKIPAKNSKIDPMDRTKFASDPAQGRANKYLSGKKDPDRTLNLADVRKFFQDISRDGLASPTLRKNINGSLKTIRNLITDFGTTADKGTWDNTIYLLINNNKRFRSEYENNPNARYFNPNNFQSGTEVALTTKALQDNWTSFVSQSGVDTDSLKSTITDKEYTKADIQLKRDMFNIDMRNYASESGQFPADVNSAISTLFSGLNTIPSRLKKITEFTKEMKTIAKEGDSDLLNSMSLKKLLSSTLIADFLNSVIEDMDSGSSAYLFESFLAALFGGNVEGKSLTDEGKMGGVDFTLSGGASGSAKLYSNKSGISQAVGGFKPNEPIFYVVGIKNKNFSKEITSVDLYHFILYIEPESNVKGQPNHHEDGDTSKPLLPDGMRFIESKKTNTGSTRLAAGKYSVISPSGVVLGAKGQPIPEDGKIKLGSTSYYQRETSMGTFDILRFGADESNSFRKAIQTKARTITTNFDEAIAGLSEVQASSAELSTNLNVYATSGTSKSGGAALESLDEVETWVDQIFKFFKGIEGYEEPPKEANESKTITSDLLKKIIKETLKK